MNRQENLIQILLKAEKPLTTQELAEQLNVSSRTIRSDLEKIESEILVHSMKLEKKPRVGIWIEGTQDEKDALFLDVKGEHDLDRKSTRLNSSHPSSSRMPSSA